MTEKELELLFTPPCQQTADARALLIAKIEENITHANRTMQGIDRERHVILTEKLESYRNGLVAAADIVRFCICADGRIPRDAEPEEGVPCLG